MYIMSWLTCGREAQISKVRASLASYYAAGRNHNVGHFLDNHQSGGMSKLEKRADEITAAGGQDYGSPHLFTMFTVREGGKPYCMDSREVMQLLADALVDSLDEIDDWLTGDHAQEAFVLTIAHGERVGDGVIAELPGTRRKYAGCVCRNVRVILLPNRNRFKRGEHLPFFIETAYPVPTEKV